jgi:CRP/FNR family transcriptional regulator, polysaccharide utilization system transcription regulator
MFFYKNISTQPIYIDVEIFFPLVKCKILFITFAVQIQFMTGHDCTSCNSLNKSFFAHLSKNDLFDISEKKSTVSYKKGQTIFTAGTRPNGIYCMKKGKIKLYKIGPYGKEQIIRFVLPGDTFGMRSVLCDKNYTATAVTIEDSTVCFIHKNEFQSLLMKYPAINSQIISTLSQMLEDSQNKVTSLAQKPVRERLAETLITLNKIFQEENTSSETNSVITLTRQDLANLVGTATETIIRLLSEFKSENMISIKGRKITIIDPKSITRVANL